MIYKSVKFYGTGLNLLHPADKELRVSYHQKNFYHSALLKPLDGKIDSGVKCPQCYLPLNTLLDSARNVVGSNDPFFKWKYKFLWSYLVVDIMVISYLKIIIEFHVFVPAWYTW